MATQQFANLQKPLAQNPSGISKSGQPDEVLDERMADEITRFRRMKVKTEDLAILLQQLAAAQKSNIPPLAYIGLRARDLRNLQNATVDKRNFILGGKPSCPELIAGLDQLMASGKQFSEACTYFPKVFSPQFVSIVKGAEKGGKIEEALDRLSQNYKERVEIRRAIRSALTQPVLLAITSSVVIAIAFVKVIPSFQDLYDGLGAGEMGILSTSLMTVSQFVATWWVPLLIALIGAPSLYFGALRKFPTMVTYEAEFLLRVPLINEYVVRESAVNFLESYSELFKAGLEIKSTFSLAAATVGNKVLREALQRAHQAFTATTSDAGYAPNVHEAVAGCHPCFGRASEIYPVLQQWSESASTRQIDDYVHMLKRRLEITRQRIFELIPFITICIFGPIVGWIVAGLFLPVIELAGKLAK
jgi:type IV pilus assembly protein PilC